VSGVVPDPSNPPRGCRFHTRCPVSTPICGWEVDDVVRELELRTGTLEGLTGVERRSDVDATFAFGTVDEAQNFAIAVESETLPVPMRAALTHVGVDGSTVDLRFIPVEEVPLIDLGGERASACVLVSDHDTRQPAT
jgi:hypothetical protein